MWWVAPNLVRWLGRANGPGPAGGDDGRVDDFPPYPSGLILAGRRVVVAGGGHVAQRRVPALLAVGAEVTVVSPVVTPAIEGLVGSGEVTWHERGFEESDLDDAWYAIAATDDQDANERVSAAAEARRIFCVRADDATRATAWTPAVGRHAGVTVAVLGNRDPRRSAAVRDEILEGLREGTIVARHQRDRTPDVELVDVAKLPRGRAAQQEEINRIIVERAQAGKCVVRFKGGDSFVFGRGYEEV